MTEGETVSIVLMDGSCSKGTLFQVSADSLAWSESATGECHRLSTSQIDHLEISRHLGWVCAPIAAALWVGPLLLNGGWEPYVGHGVTQHSPDYSGRYSIVITGFAAGGFGYLIGESFRSEYRYDSAATHTSGGVDISK